MNEESADQAWENLAKALHAGHMEVIGLTEEARAAMPAAVFAWETLPEIGRTAWIATAKSLRGHPSLWVLVEGSDEARSLDG